MGIFQPVNVAGPANRSGQIQKLAQTAAQNVMRRQRMRSLIHSGAAAAGRAASVGGTSNPIASSLRMRPTGSRGSILRPPMSVGGGSLASMLASAAERATTPGGDIGGMFGAGGGGFDFGSLPDPNDPRQSFTDLAMPMAQDTPAPAEGTSPRVTAPGGYEQLTYPTTAAASASNEAGSLNMQNPAGVDTSGASGGLVHLGNGLYYDPVSDSLRGGNPAGPLGAFASAQRGRPV